MKKIVSLAFSISLVFFSCKEEAEKIPPDFLPKDKMIQVLIDVHLAEASLNTSGLTKDEIDHVMAIKYAEVMKKDSISYSQFTGTFNYYLRNPAKMDDLYQEVVNRLTALESRTRVKHNPSDTSKVNSLQKDNSDSMRRVRSQY